MSPHTISAASSVQKTANISQGTLDRNTLFCAEFLTGLAVKSLEKQKEIYWEEKRRQLGIYRERKPKEENSSAGEVCRAEPTGLLRSVSLMTRQCLSNSD